MRTTFAALFTINFTSMAGATAIFTTLNCLSVVATGQIATMLTAIKIGLVVMVGLGAFLFATGGGFANFSLAESGGTCEGVDALVNYGSAEYSFVAGFGAAMLAALWGYDGWDNLSFMAGEVKDPARNIPMAIIGSVLLVIVLYVVVHIGYFYILDPTAIASISKDSSTGMVVVSKFFGGDMLSVATGAAVAVFSVGLMLSALGVLHTSLLSASRVPDAMAKDGYVEVPLELRGEEARGRADELLARVGLKGREHHYPAQLSGCEQQRVALARAFSNRPRILFADEPTGNLDQGTGQRVVDILLELNRELGTTTVLVTHDLELARKARRVIRLADGAVVSDGAAG